MIGVFWALIVLQLVPSLMRKGISGVHEHITRVAIAGVPPEQWSVAVTRMYAALGGIFVFAILLYLGQRYLARKLASQSRMGARA